MENPTRSKISAWNATFPIFPPGPQGRHRRTGPTLPANVGSGAGSIPVGDHTTGPTTYLVTGNLARGPISSLYCMCSLAYRQMCCVELMTASKLFPDARGLPLATLGPAGGPYVLVDSHLADATMEWFPQTDPRESRSTLLCPNMTCRWPATLWVSVRSVGVGR
jgi:hypothetical protein